MSGSQQEVPESGPHLPLDQAGPPSAGQRDEQDPNQREWGLRGHRGFDWEGSPSHRVSAAHSEYPGRLSPHLVAHIPPKWDSGVTLECVSNKLWTWYINRAYWGQFNSFTIYHPNRLIYEVQPSLSLHPPLSPHPSIGTGERRGIDNYPAHSDLTL